MPGAKVATGPYPAKRTALQGASFHDAAGVIARRRATMTFMGVAVEVFGRVGELNEAFKLLELLLAMPAGREVTIPFLRVWAGFDPLRSDPRFDQLLERFAIN